MTTLNLSSDESDSAAFQAGSGTVTINSFTSGVVDNTLEYYGIHWEGFSYPSGATASAAVASLGVSSGTTDEPYHTITFEDTSAAPSMFSATNYYISGLTKTTASVLWDDPDLGISTLDYRSPPDLASIINELEASYGTITKFNMIIQGSSNTSRDLQLNDNGVCPMLLDITYTGGSTEYTENVAGTLGNLTGVTIKSPRKIVAGTIGNITGAIVKSINKPISGTLGSITGIVTKQVNILTSGILGSLSGNIVGIRIILLSIGGTLGSLSGNIIKQTNKTFAGMAGDLTGEVAKLTSKNVSGVLGNISSTLISIKLSLVNVGGTLGNLSGSLANQTNKVLSGQLGNINGIIVKTISKPISGVLGSLSGDIIKAFVISLAGTMGTISGTVLKQINKIETGTLGSLSGNVIKQTNKIVNGTVGTITGVVSGNKILYFVQAVGGTLGSLSGSIIKTTYKDFTGSISPIGSLVQFKLIVAQKVRAGYDSVLRSRAGTAVNKITKGGYDIIKRIR